MTSTPGGSGPRAAAQARTFLLTWNPRLFAWPERDDVIARCRLGEAVTGRWSTGVRTSGIEPGDSVYLIRQGDEPRGIVAHGTATSAIYQDQHWREERSDANYVDLLWKSLVADGETGASFEDLRAHAPQFGWDLRAGGVLASHDAVAAINSTWRIPAPLHRRSAWLLMVAGSGRQFAGNDGYDDDAAQTYRWDSTVNNHASVAVGDLIVLWDKKTSLGASVVEEIVTGRATKSLRRCPACGRASIKSRANVRPQYRCEECRSTFERPRVERAEVTTYATRHDIGWIDLAGTLDAARLRSLCERPRSQLSMRSMRYDETMAALTTVVPRPILAAVTSSARRLQGGFQTRTVRARVGQGAFRAGLLARYGSTCAFTGPAPAAALEAAHLYSYASTGEHDDDGGLLLRRDLHRLFDLGLIAVDPASGRLDVHKDVRGYTPYGGLHGGRLHFPLTRKQQEWLEQHWAEHRTT